MKGLRSNNRGLGYIFRKMRELPEHESLSDYILFGRIILTLRKNDFQIPERQIVDHFRKCVGANDYATKERQKVLNRLKRLGLKKDY